MNLSREEAQQILDALIEVQPFIVDTSYRGCKSQDDIKDVITLLQSRLAEGEQEPVAWMYEASRYPEGDIRGRSWHPCMGTSNPNMPWANRNVTPLYAVPQGAPK